MAEISSRWSLCSGCVGWCINGQNEGSVSNRDKAQRLIPRDLNHHVQVHECYHVACGSGSQTVLIGTI